MKSKNETIPTTTYLGMKKFFHFLLSFSCLTSRILVMNDSSSVKYEPILLNYKYWCLLL